MNQELEKIRPTTGLRLMDLVREAGVDIRDGSNMKNGIKKAASNPKYCYAWSFVQSGKVVVLNLWFDLLRQNDSGIYWCFNMREHGDQCTLHSDKDVWSKRAYEMDKAIQKASTENLPIRVIVCNGQRFRIIYFLTVDFDWVGIMQRATGKKGTESPSGRCAPEEDLLDCDGTGLGLLLALTS